MFADEVLMGQLVLKGGNALRYAYGIGSRASLDFDFSLADDFENLEDAAQRILKSLRGSFDSAGYVVFDEVFEEVPLLRDDGEPGKGYKVRFKLISRAEYDAHAGDLASLQRRAQPVGAETQKRTFEIEISKGEYTEDKRRMDLDEHAIFVYSPAMIAIEKVRAICQQMPAYERRKKKAARARDFYDIRALVESVGVNLGSEESLELFRRIFAAKEVPLALIANIGEFRDFHRAEWSYVESSVEGDVESFDYYFDFVVQQTAKLEALWKE